MGRALNFAVAVLLLALDTVAEVHAQSESSPPGFVSIKFGASQISAGQDLSMTIRGSDATGVKQTYAWFLGPGGSPSFGTPFCQGNGQLDASIQCTLDMPSNYPTGDYTLLWVWFEDTIGNSKHYHRGQDFQADSSHDVVFTFQSDSTDAQPPALTSIKFGTTQVGSGQDLSMTIRGSDATGVKQTYAWFLGPGGSPSFGTPFCQGNGQLDASIQCTLDMPSNYPTGDYTLLWVWFEDTIGNSKHYHRGQDFQADSSHDVVFTFQSASTDAQAPLLTSIKFAASQVAAGHDLSMTMRATDTTGVKQAYAWFLGPGGSPSFGTPFCHGDGQLDATIPCTLDIPSNYPAGEYTLSWVWFEDTIGNSKHYHRGQDFQADGNHDVTFTLGDDDAIEQTSSLQNSSPSGSIADAQTTSSASSTSLVSSEGAEAHRDRQPSGIPSSGGHILALLLLALAQLFRRK